MTPTYIPAVRSFTYKFTTFTHVAAIAVGKAGAESAGPLRRATAVTARWARPPAANPIPLDPPSAAFFFLLLPSSLLASPPPPAALPPSLRHGGHVAQGRVFQHQ